MRRLLTSSFHCLISVGFAFLTLSGAAEEDAAPVDPDTSVFFTAALPAALLQPAYQIVLLRL